MESPKLQFVLTGFSEALGCRIYAFERVAADRSRTGFTVTTDLALARRYGIRLQELPLLCRAILEENGEGEERALTYTEAAMSLHADSAAALHAAQKRKPPKRPATGSDGAAWRAPVR